MSIATDPTIERILNFWFSLGFKQWFTVDEEFDSKCRNEFAKEVQQARNNQLELWRESPDGALALIILLDQIPRNTFRGSGESFTSDPKARDVAVDAIARGFDHKVELVRQAFFYLPLMHSESMLSQVASLGMNQGLATRAIGTDFQDFGKMSLHAAEKHLDVIHLFGRFPARNKALGRESTSEELKFLEEYPKGIQL